MKKQKIGNVVYNSESIKSLTVINWEKEGVKKSAVKVTFNNPQLEDEFVNFATKEDAEQEIQN